MRQPRCRTGAHTSGTFPTSPRRGPRSWLTVWRMVFDPSSTPGYGGMVESRVPGLPFRSLPAALFAAPPDRPFVTMWRGDDDVESVTFGEFTQRAVRDAAYL